MITLKNVTVTLKEQIILKNITTSVSKGDFITIIGHNGAGKSTLFNLIAGKISPTSGSIYLNNQDVTSQKEQERSHLIGRLFQNPEQNIVNKMTVEDNLALALLKTKRAGLESLKLDLKNQAIQEYSHILETIKGDLQTLLKMKMGNLSGGQKQMIALVMTLISSPKILLFDEPTAALDPQAATTMLTTMAKTIKQKQITSLLITHDHKIAAAIGNKRWRLNKGALETEDMIPKPPVIEEGIDYKKLIEHQ